MAEELPSINDANTALEGTQSIHDANKQLESPGYLDYAKDIGKQTLAAVPRIVEGAATWPAQLMDVAGQGMAAIGLSDPEKEAQRQAFLKGIREKGTTGSVEKYLPQAETLPGK